MRNMYKKCEARGRSKPREILDEQQNRNAAVTTSSKSTPDGHIHVESSLIGREEKGNRGTSVVRGIGVRLRDVEKNKSLWQKQKTRRRRRMQRQGRNMQNRYGIL
eukprot:1386749-Amphidinium_carterae.1